MNWLIINLSENNDDTNILKDLLVSYNADVTICDSFENVSILEEYINHCEYCIWLGKNPYASEIYMKVAYYFGFFIGKQIPFFCVISDNKVIPAKSEKCLVFDDLTSLTNTLKDRFPEFIEKEKQKNAKLKLIEMGIPFNPDSFAFHIASDNEKECSLFFDAGIDINSRDAAGTPMLCIAARNNRKKMIEKLIDLGADINAISLDRGYSPIMDAVWKSNSEIVEILISRGANLDFISRDGQPILVLAVGTGNEKICRLLVENGADFSICDSMGMSALAYAKLFKKEKLISIFEAVQK